MEYFLSQIGISKTKEFYRAVKTRIEEKNAVIIYPEGHLWPYYTGIRPFENTSFRFPVELNVPSFCMTTTYTGKQGKKPKITIYIDGPFYPDMTLDRKREARKTM